MLIPKAKRIIQRAAGLMGYEIISHLEAVKLRHEVATLRDKAIRLRNVSPQAMLWSALNTEQRLAISSYMPYSRSQLAQDLFALSELHDKPWLHNFVEFGACDVLTLSNTWCLESQLGWQGILSEPANVWHEKLLQNRKSIIDLRCVSTTTGSRVEFLEVEQAELSGVAVFADSGDIHSARRLGISKSYQVETVTLNDLLDSNNAPRDIGYLSIDTEGSELAILNNFDFSRRKIHVITVEHNYCGEKRDKLYSLLSSHGYARKYEHISRWDDWYVLADGLVS